MNLRLVIRRALRRNEYAPVFSEDQVVEQPAIALFAELGSQKVSAMEKIIGQSGTLGRETAGEMVLAPWLRAALEQLKPSLSPEAITAIVDELARDVLLPRLMSGQVQVERSFGSHFQWTGGGSKR